jgi:hypothetical protein
MRRLIAVLLVAGLAGCASASLTGGDAPVSPAARYAAARLDLNTALVSLLGYASRPPCGPGVTLACARPGIVERGLQAATAADAALDQAGAALDGAPGIDTEAAIRAGLAALGTLQAILIAELEPAPAS